MGAIILPVAAPHSPSLIRRVGRTSLVTSFDLPSAVRVMADRLPGKPEVLVVLGSGIAIDPSEVEDPIEIPFEDLPGFPSAGVIGHPGRYLYGQLEGVPVLLQRGRFHLYEGHGEEVVVAPVRIAAELGVRIVILTNATGGIRTDLVPGLPVLIEDHLNLQGTNPFVGPVSPGEERFPDLSAPWDRELTELAARVALETGIPTARGVYAGVLGPNFETPAEIRALRTMGADVVGMSTVPEVLVARARGLRVLGISLVVNPAAGLGDGPLDHDEVLEIAGSGGRRVLRIVRGVLAALPRGEGAAGSGGEALIPPGDGRSG